MKRTGLTRKTPLKSTGTLRSSTGLKTTTPLARKPFKSVPGSIKKQVSLTRSRGLKGHGRSTDDIEWHGLVVQEGCFACNYLGVVSRHTLRIHHPAGRNKGKDGDCSEMFVICLCDQHHDPSIAENTDATAPSVHGNKKKFRAIIGSESWCVYETYRLLDTQPKWLSSEDWLAYLRIYDKGCQEATIMNLNSLGQRLRAL